MSPESLYLFAMMPMHASTPNGGGWEDNGAEAGTAVFVNLNMSEDPTIRERFWDYTFTDFGGFRRVMAGELSHMRHDLNPGSVPPGFHEMAVITLSHQSYDGFLRENPLPITERDYQLSKMHQIVYGLVIPDNGDPGHFLSGQLEAVLDRTPDEVLPRLAESDWKRLHADSWAYNAETVIERLPLYLPTAAVRPRKTRLMSSFPTPENASWSDVSIRLTSEFQAQISVGAVSGVYNSTELGFEDRRTGNPDKAWKFLCKLAQHDGYLQPQYGAQTSQAAGRQRQDVAEGRAFRGGPPPPTKKDVKRVQDIRSRLQYFFHIDGDPFQDYAKARGYRTNFRIACAPSFS